MRIFIDASSADNTLVADVSVLPLAYCEIFLTDECYGAVDPALPLLGILKTSISGTHGGPE